MALVVKTGNNQLALACMAGIVYFVMGIPETIVEFIRKDSFLTETMIPAMSMVYGIGLIAAILFFWGFVVLGRKFQNPLLWLSAILLILTSILFSAYDLFSLHYTAIERGGVLFLDAVISGFLCIGFGIGLLRLEGHYGQFAKIAGILEIVSGVTLVLVVTFLLGLILLIPATLLEIFILYKAAQENSTES